MTKSLSLHLKVGHLVVRLDVQKSN